MSSHIVVSALQPSSPISPSWISQVGLVSVVTAFFVMVQANNTSRRRFIFGNECGNIRQYSLHGFGPNGDDCCIVAPYSDCGSTHMAGSSDTKDTHWEDVLWVEAGDGFGTEITDIEVCILLAGSAASGSSCSLAKLSSRMIDSILLSGIGVYLLHVKSIHMRGRQNLLDKPCAHVVIRWLYKTTWMREWSEPCDSRRIDWS